MTEFFFNMTELKKNCPVEVTVIVGYPEQLGKKVFFCPVQKVRRINEMRGQHDRIGIFGVHGGMYILKNIYILHYLTTLSFFLPKTTNLVSTILSSVLSYGFTATLFLLLAVLGILPSESSKCMISFKLFYPVGFFLQ